MIKHDKDSVKSKLNIGQVNSDKNYSFIKKLVRELSEEHMQEEA